MGRRSSLNTLAVLLMFSRSPSPMKMIVTMVIKWPSHWDRWSTHLDCRVNSKVAAIYNYRFIGGWMTSNVRLLASDHLAQSFCHQQTWQSVQKIGNPHNDLIIWFIFWFPFFQFSGCIGNKACYLFHFLVLVWSVREGISLSWHQLGGRAALPWLRLIFPIW